MRVYRRRRGFGKWWSGCQENEGYPLADLALCVGVRTSFHGRRETTRLPVGVRCKFRTYVEGVCGVCVKRPTWAGSFLRWHVVPFTMRCGRRRVGDGGLGIRPAHESGAG